MFARCFQKFIAANFLETFSCQKTVVKYWKILHKDIAKRNENKLIKKKMQIYYYLFNKPCNNLKPKVPMARDKTRVDKDK